MTEREFRIVQEPALIPLLSQAGKDVKTGAF